MNKTKVCIEEIEQRELEAMGLPVGTVIIPLGNKQVRK
jgi:hypothetical protein